jgi:DnaJ-domain-containing protein 1
MQIIDRLSRIFKSGFSDYNSNSSSFFHNEDDELKRIIDELNSNDKTKENSNGSNKSDSYKPKNKTELENAYDVLGISGAFENENIKAVYKKKMKEFHPDKVSQQNDDVRKRAETRAKEINEAYTIIRKHRGF